MFEMNGKYGEYVVKRIGDLPEKLDDVYRLEFNWTNGGLNCWDNVKNVTIAEGHIWFDVERDDRWNRVCVNADKLNFIEFMGKVKEN